MSHVRAWPYFYGLFAYRLHSSIQRRAWYAFVYEVVSHRKVCQLADVVACMFINKPCWTAREERNLRHVLALLVDICVWFYLFSFYFSVSLLANKRVHF